VSYKDVFLFFFGHFGGGTEVLVRKNGGTWKGKRVLKGKRGGDNLDFASKKYG